MNGYFDYLSNFFLKKEVIVRCVTFTPEVSLVMFLLVSEYLALQCLCGGGSDILNYSTVNSN